MAVQQGFEIVALHRRAAIEALEHVAPLVAQGIELTLRLDALGDDFHRQAVRHGDHGTGDGQVVTTVWQVPDEGAVDLEDIDREFLEVGERRIAGAEVVDRQANPQRAQRFEQRGGFDHVLHDRRFGDFEFEHRGIDAADPQGFSHVIRQRRVGQLVGGKVHRNRKVRHASALPCLGLAACLVDDPLAERDDEVAGLRNGNEAVGPEHAQRRMVPADQRFDAEQLAGAEFDLNKTVTVSAGIQRTDYGLSNNYESDTSFSCDSYSIGFGGAIKLLPKLTMNIAYFWTNYSDYTKAVEASSTGGYNGTTLAGTNVYSRTNKVFGLGFDYKF